MSAGVSKAVLLRRAVSSNCAANDKQKAGHVPGPFSNERQRVLRCLNVAGLFTLRSRRHFKRNLLSFLERLEALHVDRRKMREQVFTTTIGRNKAKALRVVEPLHCSSCHCWYFLKYENNGTLPDRCFDLKESTAVERLNGCRAGRALLLGTKHGPHYTLLPGDEI